MGAAATCRPRPAAFAPTPRDESGRGRSPRPLPPMRSPSGGRPARPARLAKLIVTALAALLLLIGPLLSSALALGLIRVGNVGAVAFSFVPTNVGQEVGIFARHGVDLRITGFAGDARLQQAMAADAVDIGLGSGSGMAFILKGSPVKAIAAIAGPPLIFAVVVRADGSIKTIEDLRHRKVGISTVGSATGWLMNEVSQQHGWGYCGFGEMPVGDNGARLAALKAGSIDGCVVDIGSALNFVQHGDGRLLMRFGDAKNFIMHVIFATGKAMAEKPDDLHVVVKGWFESVAYVRAHKQKTIAQT